MAGGAQVGDLASDLGCWERPEDMDTLRTASVVNTSRPGSDVAAETAAAMAAASIVFNATDPAYAASLLVHATQVRCDPACGTSMCPMLPCASCVALQAPETCKGQEGEGHDAPQLKLLYSHRLGKFHWT